MKMFCVTVFSLSRSQTVQPVLRVRVGKTLMSGLQCVMTMSLLGLRLLIRVSLNIFIRNKKKYLSFTDLKNFELV